MIIDDIQWMPVPETCGRYEASSDGQIRSILSRYPRGRILTQAVNPVSGYLQIMTSVKNVTRMRKVHSMVAEAFLGPRPPAMEVRHLDGNKINNSAANLAYATHSTNQLDQVAHGTHANAKKTHCRQGHPYDEINTYVDPKGRRFCRQCHRDTH